MVYASYVNLFGENINPTKYKTEDVLDTSEEIILEVNRENYITIH